STYRSMDSFMNRKNFMWDKRKGNYVPADALKATLETLVDYPSDRVRRVVMELNKEGADLKAVALKIGFENHLDMASYMKSKGFEWSQEAGNYISTAPPVSKNEQIEQVVSNDGTFGAQQNPTLARSGDINQFLPLLEWLVSNKDGLQSLLGT